MQQKINSMEDKLDGLDEKLDTLLKQLLDPDDGFVTRVNKNTSFRLEKTNLKPVYEDIIRDFRDMQKWKATVTRALWVLYTAIIGYILKLIWTH